METIKKYSCFNSIFAICFGISMLLTSLYLAGCHSVDKLPEPPSTEGLGAAESRLDALTERRVSRIAASATVAKEAVERIEPNNSNTAIARSELDIIRAMAGEPKKEDLDYAKNRAARFKFDDKESEKEYINSIARAESLRKEIDAVNLKYEQEKSKMEAEYKAALADRDLKIKQREVELAAERKAKNEERFTWAGIGCLLAGIILVIAVPSIALKRVGFALTLSGVILGSIPLIGEEPWFKPAVGGTLGFLLVALVVSSYLSYRKNKLQCQAGVDTKTDDPPSAPTN
jgi:hypothetical protein